MMLWYALGGLFLVLGAVCAATVIAYFAGVRDGREMERAERGERAAQRRHEAREAEISRPRHLEPFPEEWTERLANTGELRKLAEDGNIDDLRRETAAFFRALSLHGWTRKRGEHAA